MNFSVTACRLAVVFFVLPSAFYLPATACMAQSHTAVEPIVKQIDHILIVSPSAKELFALLSEAFQLPVAWPMTDYGGFTCGGISLGNVNLEIILEQTPGKSREARWSGFALEPLPLRTSLSELNARGIGHGLPAPFREFQPDGSLKTCWTTVGLPDVSCDSTQVFLCEYDDGISTRRQRLAEELRSRNGGPLSIDAAKQIVYGTHDVKNARRQWQMLLKPIKSSSEGEWPVGAGPALQVVDAETDGIRSLILSVEDLDQARRFLKSQNMYEEESDLVRLGGPLLQGLNFILVQK
jgi:hypothetical protein